MAVALAASGGAALNIEGETPWQKVDSCARPRSVLRGAEEPKRFFRFFLSEPVESEGEYGR